jgi:copper chaperone NosL
MGGNIGRKSRIALVIAAAFLSIVFIFPIWTIDLWAPQYPEGLGLKIWLTKVTGDLDNINLLNHYIGMHAIKPNEIPELKLFTYFFAGLMALILLAAGLGKRIFLHLVSIVFILFSVAALYDFYIWEYKYGHELNPEAAIIMEGESYQPPLLGKKQLANIEATSLPDIGGYGHIISLFLVLGASVVEIQTARREGNT